MRRARLLFCFLFCGIHLGGQGTPQFDAATVKRAPNGFSGAMKGGPGTGDPGRVTWEKAWFRDLVAKAYHIDDARNIAGPDWIGGNGSPIYTFTATMPADTSRHDFEIMLQNFLITQFKMTLHHEPRTFPAYDLVVVPGGTKLKLSDDQSDPPKGDLHVGDPETDAEGFAVAPTGRHTAIMISGSDGFHGTFQRYSMPELAGHLLGYVTPPGDRTHYVFDKTGLAGRYDFRIKFDNRNNAIKFGPNVQAAVGAPDPLDPGSGLPDIFKALEQQLGLRLIKTKNILVDTIVIDHADKVPVGN